MEQELNRATRPLTQAYTPHEKALIAALAARRGVTSVEIESLFPRRTVRAIRKQLVEAKRSIGLLPEEPRILYSRGGNTMLDRDDPGIDDGWQDRNRDDLTEGSACLLAALLAA